MIIRNNENLLHEGRPLIMRLRQMASSFPKNYLCGLANFMFSIADCKSLGLEYADPISMKM